MFNFIKEKLQKIYSSVTQKLHTLFAIQAIDQETLNQLRLILLSADAGPATTEKIITHLQNQYKKGFITKGQDLYQALQDYLLEMVTLQNHQEADVYILVGINGSGKTTFAGKFAHFLHKSTQKKLILAAADTFRAAAPEQLALWATKSNAQIFTGKPGQDPAAVVFGACETFKNQQEHSTLIIDTAGRLQTKEHLLRELAKIKRVVEKQLPHAKICTLLTIDAMLGQNSFDQAKIFHEVTKLDGIVLTKLDGTGKGGIIFSIADQLHLPVNYISYGEGLEDIALFNAKKFVLDLLAAQNTHE